MCLTIPARVLTIDNQEATVEFFNKKKARIIIATLPKTKVNDWILTSANLAIKKISSKEAQQINNIYRSSKM